MSSKMKHKIRMNQNTLMKSCFTSKFKLSFIFRLLIVEHFLNFFIQRIPFQRFDFFFFCCKQYEFSIIYLFIFIDFKFHRNS